MRWRDTRTGYGWLSIALHWLTAIAILTIWFVGSSIQNDLAAGSESSLRLHTSIAISAYVLLWFRVIWRFKQGHPGGGVFGAGRAAAMRAFDDLKLDFAKIGAR